MKRKTPMSAFTKILVGATVILLSGGAAAQSDRWSDWLEKQNANRDGVSVSYRYKSDNGALRVQWKCKNWTAFRKSCSVGAGNDKTYRCGRQGVGVVGETGALGERATVAAFGEYVFPGEVACKGLQADYIADAQVEIAIEKE
jgi:hypothetical protein